MAIGVAVLTVSDGCAAGRREDRSGVAIANWATTLGYDVVAHAVVPDEATAIAAALVSWADDQGVDVILTTGGTGLSPRDVTPEATRAVIDREAPGIAEAIRSSGLAKFPRAMLSRGIAGLRGHTLIVNLPGSAGGVQDGVQVLESVLRHAVSIARGEPTDH